MAAKPRLLRELNNLPEDALKEVANFITHLKKCRERKQSPKRNGKSLASRQAVAIKKWAGRNLGNGYSGRDHDAVLYG
ncbi:MAG: hypothetical protein M3N35_00525 [Candidatus Binatota bacterium]|nr:hypothetical protein [Candidatus Binatota bacterium]